MQLVPGTEVAVAPKRRKKDTDSHQVSPKQTLVREQVMVKGLLRIQAPNMKLVHRMEVKGVELGVVLTSVAFIHPETAQKYAFNNLQFVTILLRLSVTGNMQNKKDNALKKMNDSSAKEGNFDASISGREASKHPIVRLLFSDSVARGHVILPESLRLYLRADIHSCEHRNTILKFLFFFSKMLISHFPK